MNGKFIAWKYTFYEGKWITYTYIHIYTIIIIISKVCGLAWEIYYNNADNHAHTREYVILMRPHLYYTLDTFKVDAHEIILKYKLYGLCARKFVEIDFWCF